MKTAQEEFEELEAAHRQAMGLPPVPSETERKKAEEAAKAKK
jgi:hypothetical protein